MFKRILPIVCISLAALLVVPVVIAQLSIEEPRTLEGVQLDETTHTEVEFVNEAQDIKLGGLLFLPEGAGPFPGVVVIQGSGTSQRDNPWYLTFTSYLQKNGIAVLLPDKRGSEESEGDWRTASFQDLATDTEAAIAFLQNEHGDRISKIGILGASQGGQIVPIVASQRDDLAFAINMVGSVVPFHDTLRYEENHNIRQMGLLPGFSNVIAYASSAFIRHVAQAEFWDAVGNYDPLPFWKKVKTPSLVLYGAEDTNCDTATSVERLNSIDNPNIEIEVYEGSGHALETPREEGNNYVREEALKRMRDFIKANTGQDGKVAVDAPKDRE